MTTPMPCDAGAMDSAPNQPQRHPDIPVTPPNTGETDPRIGDIRRLRLLPYACARNGWPLPPSLASLDHQLEFLSLNRDIKRLVVELGVGEKKIRGWVDYICRVGLGNLEAKHFLKQASDGGRGKSRLRPELQSALEKAIHKACVINGLKPGKDRAYVEICASLRAEGFPDDTIPSRKVIGRASKAPAVIIARTAHLQGDHMTRVVGDLQEIRAICQCVQMDGTSFTCKDDPRRTLYILNQRGEILGIGNAIFGLDVATRGLWTLLGVVNATNSFLTGIALHRGLLSKAALMERYGLKANWPWQGKPGHIITDCGSEFISSHVHRVLDDRGILFTDRCPKHTPHYRGHEERFNRTAHLLFGAFLESEIGRKYFREVPGKPHAKGILLSQFDQALVEWAVTSYHAKEHAGLGGATPLARFDDLANGRRGFRLCGVPQPVSDTPHLMWDFLWGRPRVVNHIGIFIEHRRYKHPRLSELFRPGHRSSQKKVDVRVNPYGMGYAYVRLQGPGVSTEILPVPWAPDIDRLPMDKQQAALALNPSVWEWRSLLRDLRRANVPTTEANAVSLAVHREEQAQGDKLGGAPSRETRMRERADREMRKQFENVAADLQGATANDTARRPVPRSLASIIETARLLPTGAGGAAEY